MNRYGQTICLSMIVRDEAHVIRRCIESVRPIISHWAIVDTGSTDGTQNVVRAALADLPGALIERPWVDFAFNRNEALDLARPRADYSLIIDADDALIIPPGFVMPELSAAGYRIEIVDEQTRYWRKQLVSNKCTWYYRGVLHEFLYCPDEPETPILPLAMRRGDDGARHRDQRNTDARDIAVLEKALPVEEDPYMIARYTFYLANSYYDAKQYSRALKYYMKRAEQGYWDEEIYFSLLMAAGVMEELRYPADRVLAAYDRAILVRPMRAEARHGASRFCRRQERYRAGYRYAEAGRSLAVPSEGISLNPWVYAYGVLEELAINAFHINQGQVCLSACLDILKQPDVPREILVRTADLARRALARMIDPAWGCQPTIYRAASIPAPQA